MFNPFVEFKSESRKLIKKSDITTVHYFQSNISKEMITLEFAMLTLSWHVKREAAFFVKCTIHQMNFGFTSSVTCDSSKILESEITRIKILKTPKSAMRTANISLLGYFENPAIL